MPTPIDTPGYRYATYRIESDGVQQDFEFSFAGGYLNASHVTVYQQDLEGVQTKLADDMWSLTGPSQIHLNTAMPEGYVVVIRRDTPKDLPLLDYADGAILSNENLNRSNKQGVYVAAEMVDLIADMMTVFGGSFFPSNNPIAPRDPSYICVQNTTGLPNERRLRATGAASLVDGGPGGDITVNVPDAKFVTVVPTTGLSNERVLTAGDNITIEEDEEAGTITINGTAGGGGGADPGASFLTLEASGTLANERVLTPGTNINFEDNGPGGDLVINATLPAGSFNFLVSDANAAIADVLGTSTMRDGSNVLITANGWDGGMAQESIAILGGASSLLTFYQSGGWSGSVGSSVLYGSNIQWKGNALADICIGSGFKQTTTNPQWGGNVILCAGQGIDGAFERSFVSFKGNNPGECIFSYTTYINNDVALTNKQRHENSVIIGKYKGSSGNIGAFGPYEQANCEVAIGDVVSGDLSTPSSSFRSTSKGACTLGGTKTHARFPGGLTWSIDSLPYGSGEPINFSNSEIGAAIGLVAGGDGFICIGNQYGQTVFTKTWNNGELPANCKIGYAIKGFVRIDVADGGYRILEVEAYAHQAMVAGSLGAVTLEFQDAVEKTVSGSGAGTNFEFLIDFNDLKGKCTASGVENTYFAGRFTVFASWYT